MSSGIHLLSHWDMSTINPPDIGWRRLGNDGVGTGLDPATDIVDGIAGGKALELDGTEYVNLPTPTTLQIPLPLSVSMWVKVADLSTHRGLFENDVTATGYGVSAYVISPAGTVVVTYFDGGGAGPTHRRRKHGTTVLAFNRWYHVTTVFQGPENMQIYINGVDALGVYTGTGGAAVGYSGGDGKIGFYSNLYWSGVIDEIMIFDAALSQLQAVDLYNRTRQGRF